MLTADGSLQIRHLHRRQRRLESLVAHLQPGAINGLLERFAGENSEGMRHSSFLRGLSNTPRDFVDDDVVVSRASPQQTANTNDRVVFAGFGERAGSRGDFKRAGHADNVDVLIFRAGAKQAVVSAAKQTIGDEFIEPRYDDAEAEP